MFVLRSVQNEHVCLITFILVCNVFYVTIQKLCYWPLFAHSKIIQMTASLNRMNSPWTWTCKHEHNFISFSLLLILWQKNCGSGSRTRVSRLMRPGWNLSSPSRKAERRTWTGNLLITKQPRYLLRQLSNFVKRPEQDSNLRQIG